MKMKNIKILWAFYVIALCTFCKSQENKPENKCALKETCGMCIRDSDCVWCNEPFIENSNLQRCEYISKSNNTNWCPPENIINPQSNGEIIKNLPLESSTTAGKEAIQISPQRVKLTLRPGQQYELNFKYATAKDYPVDLYYIMDLSASMDIHKQKLSVLGNLLSETMRKLTKSFRIGFGSFVDKVAMPYTSTHSERVQNPCFSRKCTSPYSFKNHLPLTDNSTRFTNEVRDADVSGNLDFIEGGLDALMQAIICQKEIGWRLKARRLIVFSGDADYHIAGDGKLAGIVLPNDGECHLKNNEYTHGTILDYPSIGHIAHKVKEHNVNLIFAIVQSNGERVKEMYKILEKRIEGSSLAMLSGDSSNVVDLVKEVYDKIVDSVRISDNSDSNIEVKYFSSCRTNEEKETNECKNLQVGDEVDFKALIKVLNCPRNHKTRTQVFEIKPGALNESLIVEVEMICNCECEKEDLKKTPECHNSGSLQCGVCKCDSGKFGTNCECDGETSTSSSEDKSNCQMSNTSAICSGLGTCKCNKCDCQKRAKSDEKIDGKFCECTNYSCQKIGGNLCSNNGECVCGICKCFAGYVGEACQCRNLTDTCTDNKGELCNGHGSCSCGTCACADSYFGQFCQECPTCKGQLCEELRDCVECVVHKTGIFDTEEKCAENCSGRNIKEIETIDEESSKKEKICRYVDDQDCTFYYKYYYDENDETNLKIFAQKTKICAAQISILALLGGIIGSILLAGLILLLFWKGITTVHDRREYAKFDNERNNAKWNRGENPLFKNPTSTFRNPTYNTMEN